jgi:HCOMODA/2-hydroxy-3-carboxy-muconic semialdehyde decarboxylase
MPDNLAELREELSIANRILANEGILDAFGHVSVRHPDNPGRFLISRHRAPELVEPSDILEYTLDTEPVEPTNVRHYGERVIHGAIYQARPDVMAVCHHHAPAVLPYSIARKPLVPVYHMGATMGWPVPYWDSRDDFGDTSLLVVKPEEGHSLAKALGQSWTVLMGRHGATVAATTIRELVFRTIYTNKNAEMQTQAHLLGHVERLTDKEIELASAYNLRPGPVERAWEYWVRRAIKTYGPPAGATAARAPRKKSAAVRSAKVAPASRGRKPTPAKRATRKRRR